MADLVQVIAKLTNERLLDALSGDQSSIGRQRIKRAKKSETLHEFANELIHRHDHVHFRNVRVQKPYEKYTEVWLDEGEVNMIADMKELVRVRYPRWVYPEHPRALDADRERPDFKSYYPVGGGYAGYARAMLQAALSS